MFSLSSYIYETIPVKVSDLFVEKYSLSASTVKLLKLGILDLNES